VPRKGKGKGKGKGKDEGKGKSEEAGGSSSKFTELWNSSGLTCLKKGNGVQLVGDKAEVAKWKVVLKECLKEAGEIPCMVKLSFEQTRLWTQERLDGVKASSGADKVEKVSRQRENLIQISGSDAQKEKAKTAIEETNTKLSASETIDDVSEGAKRNLVGKNVTKMREVETQHGVFVSVDRKGGNSVKIFGEAGKVTEAKKQLEALISDSAGVTREIEIEWDEGRVVIGKGGSTVNQIRRDSGLDTLKVEEAGEKKKVILTGSEEACTSAEKMIQDALKKDKEQSAERAKKREEKAAAAGEGGAEAAEKPAPKKAAPKKKAEDEAPAAEKKDKNWGKSNGKPKVEYDASKASFPSLGGDAEKGSKGGRPQNSAWAKAAGAEEPAEGEDAGN